VARLSTIGFEFGSILADGFQDQGGFGTGEIAYETSTVRTGARSLKIAGTATDAYIYVTPSIVSGRAYFMRAYWRIAALPSGADEAYVMGVAQMGSEWFELKVTQNGELRIQHTGSVTVDSSSGLIAADTWYRIELKFQFNTSAGSNDLYEVKLDGTTVIGPTTATICTTAPGRLFWGQNDAASPSGNPNYFIDDLAVNDDQGSDQNTWPGEGSVYTLRPVSDPGTSSANWQKPGGSTSNRHTSVDNIPPVYETYDSTSSSAEDYVRNAVSGAGAQLNLTTGTYTAAGVGASDTVTVVQPVATTGSSSGTNTAGTLGAPSNPTIAQLSFTTFDNGIAGSAESSWLRQTGTVTYNPSVTKGTGVSLRVEKTTATTRVAIVNSLGILVEAQPASGTTYTKSGFGRESA
jgi:hypothetical protein